VSGLEQAGGNMHTDESRRSCHENFHSHPQFGTA
jgi:hypothetical protein